MQKSSVNIISSIKERRRGGWGRRKGKCSGSHSLAAPPVCVEERRVCSAQSTGVLERNVLQNQHEPPLRVFRWHFVSVSADTRGAVCVMSHRVWIYVVEKLHTGVIKSSCFYSWLFKETLRRSGGWGSPELVWWLDSPTQHTARPQKHNDTW